MGQGGLLMAIGPKVPKSSSSGGGHGSSSGGSSLTQTRSSGDDAGKSGSRGRGSDHRAAWFSAALVLFVLFSGVEFWNQHPRADPFQKLEPTDWHWWTRPLEWNAARQLPRIDGDLNAIAVTPGTRELWVAGEGGLILHSPDGGKTWERQGLAQTSDGGTTAAPHTAPLAPPPRETRSRPLSAGTRDALATLAFLRPPAGAGSGPESDSRSSGQSSPQQTAPPRNPSGEAPQQQTAPPSNASGHAPQQQQTAPQGTAPNATAPNEDGPSGNDASP